MNDDTDDSQLINTLLLKAAGDIPREVTADELVEALRLNIAQISFPALRNQFASVAVSKLSQRITDLDVTSSREKLDDARAIDKMLLKQCVKANFYMAAFAVCPKGGALRTRLVESSERFQNLAANDVARFLKISYGERPASQMLPRRMQNEITAKVCERLQLPDLAGLIRRSLQPL